MILCGVVFGSFLLAFLLLPNKRSTSDSSTASSVTLTPPSPVLDLAESGGTIVTNTMTVPSSWNLIWSYDCSGTGHEANFVVNILNANGSRWSEPGVLASMGPRGNGVKTYNKAG